MHSAIRSPKFNPIRAVGLRAVTRDFVLVAHARIAPMSVQPSFNGRLGKGACMLSSISLARAPSRIKERPSLAASQRSGCTDSDDSSS